MTKQFIKKMSLTLGVLMISGSVTPASMDSVTQVEAASVIKYTTTDNVNLRSSASTKGKILTVVKKGQSVTYVGKSGSWFKVKYGTKTGYMSSSYLKKSSLSTATTKSTTTTSYVTTTSVALKTGRSSKYKTLTTIPKGKSVKYVKAYGSWTKVSYGAKTGYVPTKYVSKKTTTTKPSTTSYVTTTSVALKSGRSSKYKTLTTIPKGKSVTFVKAYGSWTQVKYGAKTGYVPTKYISKGNASVSKEEKFATKKLVTSKTTVLYDKTTSGKKQLKSIPKGTTVSTNTKLNGYYKVTYGGKTGWASASNLATPTVVKKNFLKKSDSIKQLTSKTFKDDTRNIFKYEVEDGVDSLNSYLVGASDSVKQDYLFAIGTFDSTKLFNMSFVMSRYNKHPYAQEKGMQAVELGVSGFFGAGTPETKELEKLVKANMKYTGDKLININIGGRKGYIIVTMSTIEVMFDYDGSLPTITL